ncbi:MAG: segregation/condensation protein A [Deltaproteobacteria bacterium]|nr:segregation/condensation protein A [Deltaproteobacteria bacterium]
MKLNNSDYKVKLDIFEGPMDLLVYLIKKNEVDIQDIPISLITEQYLYYLELIKAMNIELAAEFLLMAATLAHIKSKMLLPVAQDEDTEAEDPREEITRPLIEYLKIKSAAQELEKRNILGINTFVREGDINEFKPSAKDDIIEVGLFQLIEAFSGIMDKLSSEEQININVDIISIKDKINEIVEILETKKTETFLGLFEKSITKMELITTFLAILEMKKLKIIDLIQTKQEGVIRIILN